MSTPKEQKAVWNFFVISQWEEEEKWLNEMAREGWNFVRVEGICRYIFEKGTPREYIYKLDLPDTLPHGLESGEYQNFLAECGISIVCKKKQWMYLQKRATDGPFSADGDMFAKLRMANKAYGYAIHALCKLLRAFALIIIVCLFGTSVCGSLSNFALADILEGVMQGIGIGGITALAIIFVPIVTKLRKRMNEIIDDLGVNH